MILYREARTQIVTTHPYDYWWEKNNSGPPLIGEIFDPAVNEGADDEDIFIELVWGDQ